MPTIEPVNFWGFTPWQINFNYTISPGNTVAFAIHIPEPNVGDTAALESLIALIDASPDWEFTGGSITRPAGQTITP